MIYDWADRLLDGNLADTLREMRADGLTIDQVVDALRDKDVEVSRETVRRWLAKIDPERAA